MIRLLIVFSLLLVATAHAADPKFPPGSRVGLVPPEGFVVARGVPGFQDSQRHSLILLNEYPASAYADIESRVANEEMFRQGVVVESREPMQLPTGPAFLVVGRQEAGGTLFRRWFLFGSTPDLTVIVAVQVPDAEKEHYSDATVRAALVTLAVRPVAPVEEKLGALPFELRELAGFRLARVLGANAALLAEDPAASLDVGEQTLVLVATGAGAPPADPGERNRFAQRVLSDAPGVREIRVRRSEPLRVAGAPGHEILADAKDAKTGTEVTVAQWLRFGINGYIRVLALVRKTAWSEVYPRLRAVRDGVDPR
jgi:hypothetical protein